jgi:misacylated tRNA(Ala) deacylase
MSGGPDSELFREDSYLQHCSATIVGSSPAGLSLDRTVFYPEGGGQPGDRGTLVCASGAQLAIIDTQRNADGGILLVLADGPDLPPVGSAVTLNLDWPYRYRHMRTHTCLHLLCALVPHAVTGGSISKDKGRLDFDMSEAVDKLALEAGLNELVRADHSVGFRWVSDAEMQANMDLVRTMSVKPPTGQGQVRLIDVAGVDLQPCGGTHVARTSEIGVVRLGKVEKKGQRNRRINLHLE